MLTTAQVQFLLEVLRDPRMAVPIAKARVAADTVETLERMEHSGSQEKSVNGASRTALASPAPLAAEPPAN